MVRASILVVTALLAVAVSSPTLNILERPLATIKDVANVKIGIEKSILSHATGGDSCEAGKGTNNPVSKVPVLNEVTYILGCYGDLADILVTDVAGISGSILRECSKKVGVKLDVAVGTIINLSSGLGFIVNGLIPGLGTLLGNLVLGLGQIIVCIRTPSSGLFRKSCDLCSKNYGKNYGFDSYPGPFTASAEENILKHYGLFDGHSRCQDLISEYKKNGGQLTGTKKIVVEAIERLFFHTKKSCKSWKNEDLVTAIVQISISFGAIGEGYEEGFGIELIDALLGFCDDAFKKNNFPQVSSHRDEIIKKIQGADFCDFNGCIRQRSNINNNSYKGSPDTFSSEEDNKKKGHESGDTTYIRTSDENIED